MKFTLNQKKAHDLNRHISVTAGAGSGKTAVLIHRYLKILLEKNLRPNQVVAITFTEKAAAELKQRIVREIDTRLTEGWDKARLERIKEGMTAAQISTIHSFCARILREFPVEAGVAAGFSVLQGIEQRFILHEIISTTLKRIAHLPKGEDIREQLAELLRMFGKRRLEAILYQLTSQRDVLDRLTRNLYRLTDTEVLNYWRESAQAQFEQRLSSQFPIDHWVHCLDPVLLVAKGKNAARVQELTDQIQRDVHTADIIPILTEISALILTQSGTISKRDFLGSRVKTDGIEAEIDFLLRGANHFQSFPTFTDDDALLIRVTRRLLGILEAIRYDYEYHKLQQGQLDFEDLQIKVRDLLQDESIRTRLAQRYAYIMVDEYQDTNLLQYEILKPLISAFESGNLFIVGDQKQSIYGFRGADVRVFHQTQREMTDYQSARVDDFEWDTETLPTDESEKHGDVHLPENFRLLRNLVGFVNLVFQPLMGTTGLNEYEVAYEPLIQGRANDQPGDVEILIGSQGRTAGDQEPCPENDLISAYIRHLIGTKATVWERSGEGEEARDIRYGDIAILIRSRTHLPEIESALLKAEIPYKITGGIGFYQRQEIYDIYNYLQFLINPDDGIALVGVLRAPFFGISDAALYELSLQPEGDSFWTKVQAYVDNPNKTHHISSGPSISHAVSTLRGHIASCRRLPISILIRKIVNDTGMIGVLPVGQQGEQRWANYEKLLAIAREFEKTAFTDMSDFLERLNLLIEEEEREGQAATQLTEDAVQVMTVHAAKGLEFPVVILPHLHRKFRYDQEPFIDDLLGVGLSPAHPAKSYEKSAPGVMQLIKERAKNRTVAEEKRLFYVAATRARDRLVLSGTLNRKGEAGGWFGWLLDSLEISGMPQADALHLPVTIEALSEVGNTPVSFDLSVGIIKSLNTLDEGEKPRSAPSPAKPFPAVHIHPLQASSAGGTFSVTALSTYAHCPTRFHLSHQLGVPDFVLRPTQYRAQDDVVVELPGDQAADGTAEDTAVHNVLARLGTLADCQRDWTSLIHRAVRATGGTVSADTVREHVQGFLRSDIGRMALAASESACERHIYAQIGPHIINGTVDRLFKDSEGSWHLIDYKTDAIDRSEIASRVDGYRPQIELYALLVHRLYPEQSAIPVTIFFTHLGEAVSIALTADEFEAIEKAWPARIETIQKGTFEKNRAHCPLCPYFVDEQCLGDLPGRPYQEISNK